MNLKSLWGLALLLMLTPAARAENLSAMEARMLSDLKYLADDEREGRGVGTEGLNQAAEFIRQEFEKAGLDVTRLNGGAFQPFKMTTGSALGEGNRLTLIGPDGQTIPLEMNRDYEPCSFGSSGEFDSEVVFVGYAIESEKQKFDEFKDVDVKDKVVVILRRVPRQNTPNGPFTGAHGELARESSLTTKVSNAFRRGARAVLFVNDPFSIQDDHQQKVEQATEMARKMRDEVQKVREKLKTEDTKETRELLGRMEKKLAEAEQEQAELAKQTPVDELMAFGYGGNPSAKSLPIAHITVATADKFLKPATGLSLGELEARIDETMTPQSALLKGWKVQGNIQVKKVESEIKNVIGVLEGEGPLKDETIIIGAHYDHVGLGGEGSLLPGSTAVHNGADDNASGTVALIELARHLAADGRKHPRRLVFIAFTGEERGLLGSAHYCREPLFPLDKTIAMLNMDMIGRLQDEKLIIYGNGTSPRWQEKLPVLGNEYGFDLSLKPEGFGPSDHSSFYAKKIPVLHFFTGVHTDYHKPSDDWEKINLNGMSRVLNLLKDLVLDTANTEARPEYLEVKAQAQIERTGSRPYFGSIPDFGGEGPGYGISGVTPGSPAAIGGLQGGDRIIQLGEDKIGALDDFDLALRKFSAGQEVKVVVLRGGKEVPLTVKLAKPR